MTLPASSLAFSSASVPATAHECAAWVGSGAASALEIVEAALARTIAGDREINSFTALTADRARAEARAVDAARARGTPAAIGRGTLRSEESVQYQE